MLGKLRPFNDAYWINQSLMSWQLCHLSQKMIIAGLPSSPGSFSIKSEPFSPRSTVVGSASSFPPSPSGSESSTDSNTMTMTTSHYFGSMDTSEVVTMCHIDETTPPVSPITLDMPNIINIGPLTGIQCITLDRGNKGQQQQHQQQQQQQQNTSASSVVNMSNLNKAKIPIPKINKTGNVIKQIDFNLIFVFPFKFFF